MGDKKDDENAKLAGVENILWWFIKSSPGLKNRESPFLLVIY